MIGGGHQAGLVGKLPAHGDFVRRGPVAAAALLDDWLGGTLAAMPAADRRAILERLPLWAFVATGTSAGTLAGGLCASNDRAGRLYPLAVFVVPPEGAAPVAWAMAACRALGDVSPDVTADALVAALAATAPADEELAAPLSGSMWWRADATPADAILLDAMPTAAELAALLTTEAA